MLEVLMSRVRDVGVQRHSPPQMQSEEPGRSNYIGIDGGQGHDRGQGVKQSII